MHSTQRLESITYISPSLIALTGHSGRHTPHATQSSVILRDKRNHHLPFLFLDCGNRELFCILYTNAAPDKRQDFFCLRVFRHGGKVAQERPIADDRMRGASRGADKNSPPFMAENPDAPSIVSARRPSPRASPQVRRPGQLKLPAASCGGSSTCKEVSADTAPGINISAPVSAGLAALHGRGPIGGCGPTDGTEDTVRHRPWKSYFLPSMSRMVCLSSVRSEDFITYASEAHVPKSCL